MFFGFFVVFFFAYFLKKNCSRAAALAFHLALRQRRRGTVDSCPCTHYVEEQLSFLLFVVSDTNVLSLASRSATNHNHQPPTTSIKTQTSRCRKLSGVRTCPPPSSEPLHFFVLFPLCVCVQQHKGKCWKGNKKLGFFIVSPPSSPPPLHKRVNETADVQQRTEEEALVWT